MKFKTLTGSLKRVSKPRNYLVDWDKASKSKLQFNAKQFLRAYWSSHIVFEEFPVAGTRLRFDFYNANKKIAVEVHGAQHTKYVPFFHGRKSKFVEQIRRDQQKIDFCELNNITLVEIFDGDPLDKKTFKKAGVVL